MELASRSWSLLAFVQGHGTMRCLPTIRVRARFSLSRRRASSGNHSPGILLLLPLTRSCGGLRGCDQRVDRLQHHEGAGRLIVDQGMGPRIPPRADDALAEVHVPALLALVAL